MKTKITFLVFLTLCPLHLFSTNYTVNSNADSGAGSLRQAITDANASSSTPHTITFGGNYTITLASVLPSVGKTTTIDGDINTIEINTASSTNMLLNSAGVSLTLKNLTFNKAIISASGPLNATNCIFKNSNPAAVKVSGVTFTATNCTFDSNTGGAGQGSAITTIAAGSIVSLTGCKITNNSSTGGAAVYVQGNTTASKLEMINCIVSGNTNSSTSTVYGGGIASAAATTTITNCQISGNTANRGGGIALLVGGTTAKSSLTMTGCTVSGNNLGQYNASAYGGGIYIQGGATFLTDNSSFTNCTISGNSTPVIGGTTTSSAGGGVEIGGGGSSPWIPIITFNNCSIIGNYVQGNPGGNTLVGGGIDLSKGNVVLNYCIIASNNSNSSSASKDLTIASANLGSSTGRNLYGGTVSFLLSGYTVTTGNVNLSADISTILNTSLTDNGGTTALPDGTYVKTHALVAGCSATNPSVAGSGLQTTDQRGIIRSTPDMGAYEYVTYRSKASGNWGSTSSWQSGDNSTWSDVTVLPTANVAGSIAIQNGHEITVAANATSPALTINSGGKLTINSVYTLGITGNLTINSDATNGTATLVDKNTGGGLTVSGTSTINQYLNAARNWYISSPASNATAPAGYGYYQYNEAGGNTNLVLQETAYWRNITIGSALNATKGYVAQLASANGTISFSGALNSGDKTTATLTRTGVNGVSGFNLVGNPYPSYVNVRASINAAANLEKTLWYRTKNTGGSYVFDTYNTTLGVGTNANLSGAVVATVPPMQAFWVRVKSGQSSETLTFTNARRSHIAADTANIAFKIRSSSNPTQLVRLQVSNGVDIDEAIICFNENASDSYDDYDSQKRSNDNVALPEIYTTVDGEQLVINGLKNIDTNSVLPLGFKTGTSKTFTIKASEISNFDTETHIILRDNLLNSEQDITDGSAYSFSSDIVNNSTRFSLIFKSPSIVNATNEMTNNENVSVFKNANKQIIINYNGAINNQSIVSIYNTTGQKLAEKQLESSVTLLEDSFGIGVYLVTVKNAGKTVTKKIKY